MFHSAEYVFHFAVISHIVTSIDRPVDYLTTNVLGTIKVLEAARYAGVRKFVYAASSSCYGLAEEVPTTEKAPISAEYPYALSKYMGEEAVLHWGRVYKLPVTAIRSRSIDWWNCWKGTCSICPSAPASLSAPGRTFPESRASWAGNRAFPSNKGLGPC